MRIAVVTPIFRPADGWLEQCHASVRAQTHACTHILISDGDGPNPLLDFVGQFIQLSWRHDDYGDTPVALGSVSAFSQGFDAIAYLDDDCWYEPEHIASLVELHERTGASVCSSLRKLYDYQDNFLQVCPSSDGVRFVDTNCYMIWRAARQLCVELASMPREYHAIGDRYLFHQMRRQQVSHANSGIASVCYRTRLRKVFLRLGLQPPADAAMDPHVLGLIRKLNSLP